LKGHKRGVLGGVEERRQYDVAAADFAAPSKQVKEANAELAEQADVELAKFKTIKEKDVPALNVLIREQKVEMIGLGK
jgi:hypothetical protein